MDTAESEGGSPARLPEATQAGPQPRSAGLWWCVGALFAVQIAAWIAWFVFASHQRIEEVPLVRVERS